MSCEFIIIINNNNKVVKGKGSVVLGARGLCRAGAHNSAALNFLKRVRMCREDE